jgi:hypothetical protein
MTFLSMLTSHLGFIGIIKSMNWECAGDLAAFTPPNLSNFIEQMLFLIVLQKRDSLGIAGRGVNIGHWAGEAHFGYPYGIPFGNKSLRGASRPV